MSSWNVICAEREFQQVTSLTEKNIGLNIKKESRDIKNLFPQRLNQASDNKNETSNKAT